MEPWSDGRWITGRSSRWGGVAHAIQARPLRAGERVAAACGQVVEVGPLDDTRSHRHAMHPRACETCFSAVALTETLIAQNDRRTP